MSDYEFQPIPPAPDGYAKMLDWLKKKVIEIYGIPKHLLESAFWPACPKCGSKLVSKTSSYYGTRKTADTGFHCVSCKHRWGEIRSA